MRSDFYALTARPHIRLATLQVHGEERDATLVGIDNVARMMFGDRELWDRKMRDMGCLRPPWDETWVEFRMPTLPAGSAHHRDVADLAGARLGLLVTLVHPNRLADREALATLLQKDPASHRRFMGKQPLDGVVLLLRPWVWWRDRAEPTDPRESMLMGLNRLGEYQGNSVHILHEESGWSDAEAREVAQGFIEIFKPALYAFSLANCKNIVMVDNAPPPKVRAKREAKGEPVLVFKTLGIDSTSTRTHHLGKNQPQGGPVSFHICRGHQKTYTKERPLFGRLTGTFWVSQHTRGSKTVGEVKKDYEVVR